MYDTEIASWMWGRGRFILKKFLQSAVLNLGFGISFASELSVDGAIEFVVLVADAMTGAVESSELMIIYVCLWCVCEWVTSVGVEEW